MNHNTIENIDGFRLINSLHTTARQLSICTEIIKKLADKQLPKEILLQLMLKWSVEEELSNEVYRGSKGKLSDKGKQTSAFKNYLDLCESLKLVTHFNDFYSCSRLSYVLLYFMKMDNEKGRSLSMKAFYLLQLFWFDADGILYIIDELKRTPFSQKELQINFKDNFNKRLLAKQEVANPIVKNLISERYRTINYIWKKPEKYAEHLLIPRCEWLNSLGILRIHKEGSSTIYSLTNGGKIFADKIPTTFDFSISDINDQWIFDHFFSAFEALCDNFEFESFGNFSQKIQEVELLTSLTIALKVVKTSNSFKLPLFDCLIFICLDFLTRKNILIEMSEILKILSKGLKSEKRSFNLKFEGRLNESYIITNIV